MRKIIFYEKHNLCVYTTCPYRRKSSLYPPCILRWNIFFDFTHKGDVEFHLYVFLRWIFILYVIVTGSLIGWKAVISRFFHFIYDPLPTSGKGFTADYLRLSKVKITFCGFRTKNENCSEGYFLHPIKACLDQKSICIDINLFC